MLFRILPPDSAATPLGIRLDSSRWWLGAVVSLAGAGALWKVLGWIYRDLVRPRVDAFVVDARKRRPDAEDEIRIASRERTGPKEDTLLLAAIERVEPAHDDHVLGALRRNPAEVRALMRDTILAEDYAAAAKREETAGKALAVAEACSAALEGIAAAQLAQGEALRELPRMVGIVETFTKTAERMEGVVLDMGRRMEGYAEQHGRMAGALDEIRRRDYSGPERRDAIPRRSGDPLPILDIDREG